MRVLINYATYADRDDARTFIAPFKRVASLETLYRLIKYGGGDPEQCHREIKTGTMVGAGRMELTDGPVTPA